MQNPKKIAVLVSGGGTNLQALIDYERATKNCPYTICVVMSDHKDAFALERAKKASIPTEIVSPYAVMGADAAKNASRDEKREAVSNRVLNLCEKYEVCGIVLSGWLTVNSGKLIKAFSNRMINVHPALLPKFGGVGMWGHHVHEAVLKSGEKESGCTIHLVDAGCDTGKILVQKKVPVLADDDVDSLYARIAPEEHKAIVEGLLMLCAMM
ncbi:MAG: phosphoribosylglycinamide formyltransferase [Treponema sp.]|nr:phosphoribosylglycinamide formyltransferase [Treponema sp.]